MNSTDSCKAKKKDKSNKSKKQHCGFSAGFLLNTKSKSKSNKKQKKIKKEKLLDPGTGNKNSIKNDNPFIVPEAQDFLKQTKEWKTADMISKLKSNDNVWNSMLSSQFGTAMEEMSKNPKVN